MRHKKLFLIEEVRGEIDKRLLCKKRKIGFVRSVLVEAEHTDLTTAHLN